MWVLYVVAEDLNYTLDELRQYVILGDTYQNPIYKYNISERFDLSKIDPINASKALMFDEDWNNDTCWHLVNHEEEGEW